VVKPLLIFGIWVVMMLPDILSSGYGIIPKKFLKDKNIGPYAKLVGAYFLSYTGAGNDVCWPSQSTISEDLGISISSVKRGISELEDNGYLVKYRKFPDIPLNKLNEYKVTIINNYSDLKQFTGSSEKTTESSKKPIESSQKANNNTTFNNTTYNKDTIENKSIDEIIEDDNLKQSIELLYKLYPSKCPIKNRSTSKSLKDKGKLKTILAKMTYLQLKETIELYVKQCIETKCYVKNFATFLNNIPDIESLRETTTIQVPPATAAEISKQIDIYYTQLKHKMMTFKTFYELFRSEKISKEVHEAVLRALKTTENYSGDEL